MTRLAPQRESDILRTVTDYLSAERIFWRRINTGAVSATHKGKRRFFRFGQKGDADIWAVLPACECGQFCNLCGIVKVLFLECKTESGRQSPEQKAFQQEVESRGMKYVIIRSLEDLKEVLK